MTHIPLRSKILASGEILGITAIWGVSFAIMKNAMDILPPLWFLTCRFALAFFLPVSYTHLDVYKRQIVTDG